MTKRKANRAEELAYKALIRAINENKLLIYLDESRINRPQSPVYNPWESLLPILLPMLLGLFLMLWTGVIFGLLFIVGIILIYSNIIKKKLHLLLMQRTKIYIATSFENLTTLWEFGGLVFVNAADKKIGCVAPDGDWKDFIAANFADLMTDSQTKNDTKDKGSNEAPRN